jgi:rhodanese-related sulfurtransferase
VRKLTVPIAAIAILFAGTAPVARADRLPGGDTPAPVAPFCAGCHAATPGTMRGLLDTVSDAAQALQLDVGSHKAVLSFDRDTVLTNVASFADLGKHVREGFLVRFEERDGRRHATSIVRFESASTTAADERLSRAAFKAAVANPTVTVLDVRPTPLFEAAHVPGAASMPATAVADYPKRLPADRAAPIVLYGSGGCMGPTALRRVKQLGYTDVKLYPAGFADWISTEPSVTTPRDIVYEPTPKPGAIALSEFLQLARAPRADLVLVDLRDPIEISEPTVAHVVNIPFPQLPHRMETLTSGPEPVFFCPTGARAEMAYNLVKQAGGESRFLASGAVLGRDGALSHNRPWWAP